jgi:hypothetical protein
MVRTRNVSPLLHYHTVYETQDAKKENAHKIGISAAHSANKGKTTNTMNRQPQYNRSSNSFTLSTYPIDQTQSASYLAVCADLCSSNKYAGDYAENSDMTLHTLAHLRNGEVVRLERQEAATRNMLKGHEENSASISNAEGSLLK